MNVTWIIVGGSVLLGMAAALALAAGFIRYRISCWADAMIVSFGLPPTVDDTEPAREPIDARLDTVTSHTPVRELVTTH